MPGDDQALASCHCILHAAWCIAHRVIATAEIIDRVLAVVSGAVIMQSDVLAAFELGVVDPGTTDDPMAAVLSQLIDRQLILAEVDRYVPPEPSADAIERAAQQVRARFATAAAYDSALARSGMGEARLRRMLRDELRIRAYLDERFPSRRRATTSSVSTIAITSAPSREAVRSCRSTPRAPRSRPPSPPAAARRSSAIG